MAAAWRTVGRLRGPTGKSIRTRSRRWNTYFQGGRRQPVYRQGSSRWLIGLGHFYWPGQASQLPAFVRPMDGASLRPMIVSIEASNRMRARRINYVSIRFLVTQQGISDSEEIDPDELSWVGGSHSVPLEELRQDLLPMSRDDLEQHVLTNYCGPRVTQVTAIYSVSVQTVG